MARGQTLIRAAATALTPIKGIKRGVGKAAITGAATMAMARDMAMATAKDTAAINYWLSRLDPLVHFRLEAFLCKPQGADLFQVGMIGAAAAAQDIQIGQQGFEFLVALGQQLLVAGVEVVRIV
jgi:hypothetical protein